MFVSVFILKIDLIAKYLNCNPLGKKGKIFSQLLGINAIIEILILIN